MQEVDHQRRTWISVERSDLLVMVVDSRDPLFYRCPDLEVMSLIIVSVGLVMEVRKDFMAVLLLLLTLALSSVSAAGDAFVGVNLGTDLSDMPSPTVVVALLKAQNIRHIRLYDADRAMLLALANTGIQVTVSVPNDLLLGIGQSNATAADWVNRNVIAHVPATNITAIAVGSEVLTTLPNAAPVLLSALKFIQKSIDQCSFTNRGAIHQ